MTLIARARGVLNQYGSLVSRGSIRRTVSSAPPLIWYETREVQQLHEPAGLFFIFLAAKTHVETAQVESRCRDLEGFPQQDRMLFCGLFQAL